MTEIITLDVINCARCGQDHPVKFVRFKSNPPFIAGSVHQWWGMCPVNHEPVFMRFVMDGEQERDDSS